MRRWFLTGGRKLVFLPLAAMIAILAPAAWGGQASDRLGRAAETVVDAGVPGVAVYVRDKGQTTVVSRGYDDVVAKRPMSARDRFRIGSVTKSFVAAVVLQLVDEGKLSLDDNVEQRLPGLVPNGSAITIRQLLSHRSGLFDYVRDRRILAPYLKGDLDHVWTPLQVLRMATSHKPLFAPGAADKQSYSNTGYVILGLLIEKVTGHSLGHELKARIFGPSHSSTRVFLDRRRSPAATHTGTRRPSARHPSTSPRSRNPCSVRQAGSFRPRPTSLASTARSSRAVSFPPSSSTR